MIVISLEASKFILDDDYKRLLTNMGFNNVQIYGNYDKSYYN